MSARKFSMFVTCAMNLKRVILKDMATPTASTIPSSNLLKTGSSGPKIKILRSTKKTDYQQYTLPQKKRNFNFQIFHGNPGPGSVTPGHVHQGKPQIFRHTLFSKRKAPFNLAVGIQFREITAMTCTHMSSDCARTVRNFGIWFLTNCYQEQCRNEIWPEVH